MAPFKDVLSDPAAWAKKCVAEYGADLIVLQLKSIDPNGKNASAADAVKSVKKVRAAVDVPLVIWGSANVEKDEAVLKKIAEECQGENLILGPVEDKNHKAIGAAAMGFGHSIISSSPIDVNLAKQINILLENLGMPTNRMLIDPTTGGLGYGLEYSYSVMERIRMAALAQGDDKLQLPLINNLGNEVWKSKEAKQGAAGSPHAGRSRASRRPDGGRRGRGLSHERLRHSDHAPPRGHPAGQELHRPDVQGRRRQGGRPDRQAAARRRDRSAEQVPGAQPDHHRRKRKETGGGAAASEGRSRTGGRAQGRSGCAQTRTGGGRTQARSAAARPAAPAAPAVDEAALKAKAEADAAARAKAEADAKAKAEADAKAKAEAEAKAKAEAAAQRAADEKAKVEADLDKIRQQRVKEREELAVKRADSMKAGAAPKAEPKPAPAAAPKPTPAAESKMMVDKLIETLDWVHRRNR